MLSKEVWIKRTIWKSPTVARTNKVKHDWEHFDFKASLASLIYTQITDQFKSRGRIPQTKILMKPYLDLKALATSMIPSVTSSGESSFKLFVPHKIITFLMLLKTKRLWERHRTCWNCNLVKSDYNTKIRVSHYYCFMIISC